MLIYDLIFEMFLPIAKMLTLKMLFLYSAMERACYVVKFMLAGNADVRNKMYTNNVRFVLLNKREDRETVRSDKTSTIATNVFT